MLFRILKSFGLDIPAKVAAVQAEIESRAELAKLRLTRALMVASISISLIVLAAVAGVGAVGVGLTALYSWIALDYGEFYGYAAVGGVLVLMAAVSGVTAFIQANSWSLDSPATAEETSAASIESAGELPAERNSGNGFEKVEGGVATPALRSAGWSGGARLSQASPELIALPVTGNPLIDGVIDGLRVPASHAVDDVLEIATDTIRRGEREQLIVTLGAAVFAGWLVEKMGSRRVPDQHERDLRS